MKKHLTHNDALRIAASVGHATIATMKEALKREGFAQCDYTVVAAARDELKTLRYNAFNNRLARRSGRAREDIAPGVLARATLHKNKPVPFCGAAALADKLRTVRYAKAWQSWPWDGPAHGGVAFNFTNDRAPGVFTDTGVSWTVYSKSTKWPAQVIDIAVTLPRDWCVSVHAAGLACVDGLFTLTAERLDSKPGAPELFAAMWARKSRGFNYTCERGYIARFGGVYYHGGTPKKALAGLARKCAGLNALEVLKNYDLTSLASRAPGVLVSVRDAELIGACASGIQNWCAAAGIDIARGAIPICEAVKAYATHPRREARAAILQAVKRTKGAQFFSTLSGA